jgi:hypothetical protein
LGAKRAIDGSGKVQRINQARMLFVREVSFFAFGCEFAKDAEKEIPGLNI